MSSFDEWMLCADKVFLKFKHAYKICKIEWLKWESKYYLWPILKFRRNVFNTGMTDLGLIFSSEKSGDDKEMPKSASEAAKMEAEHVHKVKIIVTASKC